MLADRVWQEAFGGPETGPERLIEYLQTVLFNRYRESPVDGSTRALWMGLWRHGLLLIQASVRLPFPFSLKFRCGGWPMVLWPFRGRLYVLFWIGWSPRTWTALTTIPRVSSWMETLWTPRLRTRKTAHVDPIYKVT
jgi:hypothetical protein